MEIKYQRKFVAKNKKYTMGEIGLLTGYALELGELRPELESGSLAPGERCMILFAVTKEEYDWKDSDPQKLDELAEQLRTVRPRDRIIAVQAVSLTGAPVAKQLKLKTGDSIDGGQLAQEIRKRSAGPIDEKLKECRRLQNVCAAKDASEEDKEVWKQARNAVGTALSALEKLYVAYDAGLNGRFPAIGFDGRIELFTTRQRYDNAFRLITDANAGIAVWTMKEIGETDFEGFVKNCEMLGIGALRIDNGFAAAELQLHDFRTDIAEMNANIRFLQLREVECSLRFKALKEANAPEKNRNGALESMLTFRNFARREIGNAVLFAVCDIENPVSGELCTSAAREKLQADHSQVVNAEKTVLLSRKDDPKKHLAAFTTRIQAAAFAERMTENGHPVAMTFDDIAARALQADGILIDPDLLGYLISKDAFDNVRELRAKPPVAVRVKPAEKKEEQPAAVQQTEQSILRPDTALPDPDAFDEIKESAAMSEELVAGKTTEEGQNDTTALSDGETIKKKGFFKRLFGGNKE